jgi:hypothetical protein
MDSLAARAGQAIIATSTTVLSHDISTDFFLGGGGYLVFYRAYLGAGLARHITFSRLGRRVQYRS